MAGIAAATPSESAGLGPVKLLAKIVRGHKPRSAGYYQPLQNLDSL